MITIAIDYDEFNPETYRGVEIYRQDEVIRFDSGNLQEDLSQAKKYAADNVVTVFRSSSFDNFVSDCMHPKQNGGVEPLYTTRMRLLALHDAYDLSWRAIADRDEYAGISHATLRDIANGANPSPETCRALGFQKTPYRTLAIRFHDDSDFQRARAAIDAHAAGRAAWVMDMIKEMDDDRRND